MPDDPGPAFVPASKQVTEGNDAEIVAFIRAQLDDDERVARAAERHWHGVRIESATTAEEDHALRHDPARVLAEVDAKRRILDLHRPIRVRSTGSRGGVIEDCRTCDQFPAQYPCSTMRALALPYAGRPGYREGWRPS